MTSVDARTKRALARRIGLAVASGLFLTLYVVPARADLLYFRKGGEVQASSSVDGDRLFIEIPEGKYEFHRDDFRKRVPGYVPAEQWPDRFRQAKSTGFTARFEAAWWAIENGLIDEAAAMVRELHRERPNDAPTARMVAALERLERLCKDPELAEFRKTLGIATTITQGPHIVLLHEPTGDGDEAKDRVALLEKMITGYYLVFAAQGIELPVPARRLILAWFADQKDYLAFLRSQKADAFATTHGYFHPTWNAVVAYDERSSDKQREGRETAIARREELRRFQTTVDRMPARAKLRVALVGESARTLGPAEALALLDRLEREVRREELLLDLERRAINEGTSTHELIHLLAANSGLLPRHDALPIWLQEGLAMQFEVIRGGRWAGIGRVHDIRLSDWRRIQPLPRLEPLVRDAGYGRGYQRDLYAQAWSLVFFLRSQHSRQFITYLDLLRGPDATLSELSPSDRFYTAFQRAFGPDLDSLENDWHEFMASLKTPLELHAPDPQTTPPASTSSKPSARGRAPAPSAKN